MTLNQKLSAGFGAAVFVLLLMLAAALWNAVRLERTFQQVDHTHAVLTQLEQVLTGTLSMQAGARGFVLTGSDEVLAPFHAGAATTADGMRQLRELTADNPAQQRRLDELEPLLREAGTLLTARIEARRRAGSDALQHTTVFRSSQQIVERARRVIHELLSEERRLLRERMRETQRAARATIEASVACGVIAMAFVGAAAFLARRDFRERLRSEQALHKSQLMFQRLFDDAPDASIQVNQSGLIVRANKQTENLFGWPPRTLAGQPLGALLPERFVARHGGHLAAYFAAPRTRPMGVGLELYARRHDGSEFPVDIMLSPLDTDEGLQALAVIRDVTERRAIEERIRQLNLDLQLQNARLETVNTELEAFSYSVSHDLRAPLRHIDGFASLLSKQASGSLDETGHRYLGVISDAARRMGRLIDDLLTFSRMSRTQLDAAEVDQDQLVADAIREPGIDRPGIEWHIAPLPRVRADAAMLRQVWLNLLSNAAKYSAHAEPPRIAVGSLPDPDTPGGYVFFVRDNGVGFDMKYAAKLFGVFQRLHSDAEFEGTGIGLANVRRIVARHGGRTWAESTPGAGATFYFSLPPSPPDASPGA